MPIALHLLFRRRHRFTLPGNCLGSWTRVCLSRAENHAKCSPRVRCFAGADYCEFFCFMFEITKSTKVTLSKSCRGAEDIRSGKYWRFSLNQLIFNLIKFSQTSQWCPQSSTTCCQKSHPARINSARTLGGRVFFHCWKSNLQKQYSSTYLSFISFSPYHVQCSHHQLH